MWKEEYEELMFGIGHNEDTMTQAANIKYQYMPDVLYKYRAVSDNTLNALQNDILFSAPPRYFNDIFEGSIELSKPDTICNFYQKGYDRVRAQYHFLPQSKVSSCEELFASIAASFGKSYDEIISDIPLFSFMKQLGECLDSRINLDISNLQEQARNAYNICCFCAENNNNLMWSHYADQHAGFCIGYEIKKPNNTLTHLTFPVIYKDSCHVDIFDIDDIDGSLSMHMLTLKSPIWSYENEWRTFFLPKQKPYCEQMPKPCAVYLGARMKSEDQYKVYKICVEKDIPVYKMAPILKQNVLVQEPYVP